MFSRAFIVLAFIATVAMSASVNSTCDNGTPGYTHIVVAKDICWDIATEGGISVSQLLDANPGIVCGNLEIGERLCVPRTSNSTSTPSQTASSHVASHSSG
ncbi:hypothetical protein EDD18DRAFT_1151106 [Armillaria luteobubalina]|uniref:LysM domain-containing protein n=1 Tax=Armillaria luteobubalina TaxID=153913 RepID=A0AA39QCN4_9AGAR|nr:hypothetical protein EDD18DRAFT_1151106 [Armillaria luteobubalina]